jgi:hypothetical protein
MKTLKVKRCLFMMFLSLGVSWMGYAQKNKLVLSFENTFDAEPLAFKKDYVNAHGEKLSFTLLNYYVSNIKLTRKDGSIYAVPQDSSYFLVKQDIPQSKKIELLVPKGKYQSVSFIIGVDSLRSTQGADKRTGVLDVGAKARGMYWQWNSGYIFFKLEGKSPSSPDSLKNSFYYHIGGYGGFDKKTLNNIRVKTFAFDKPLKVSAKKTATLSVTVDVKQFFQSKTSLKISEHPSIMWGPVSTAIADNYVNIFSLKSVDYSKGTK